MTVWRARLWVVFLCAVGIAALSVGGAHAQSTPGEGGTPTDCPSEGQRGDYEPNEASLCRHERPEWFDDAKFGIFVHWGPYSIPAYAPSPEDAPIGGFPYTFNYQYAEWYWEKQRQNGSPQNQFHRETYGEDVVYDDFVDQFTGERFDADRYVKLFKDAGAKYFVQVTKHHDGFAIYDSATTERDSVDQAAGRDFVQEMFDAARGSGIKRGIYYSVYEWFHPAYRGTQDSGNTAFNGPATSPYNPYYPGEPTTDPYKPVPYQGVPYKGYEPVGDYVDDHQFPQMNEIIDNYDPDLIWCDGAWDNDTEFWRTQEVIANFYNGAKNRPNPKPVVVNDRCGAGSHADYATFEGAAVPGVASEETAEATRGIGLSFGYNRYEAESAYLGRNELVDLFVNLVSKNYNLLLNVGPRGDGSIPKLQQDRLLAMGRWLDVNGQAIYGSRPWRQPEDDPDPNDDDDVRFTVQGDQDDPDAFYIIARNWPGKRLVVRAEDIPLNPKRDEIVLLGHGEPLKYRRNEAGDLVVRPPKKGSVKSAYAFTFRIAPEK